MNKGFLSGTLFLLISISGIAQPTYDKKSLADIIRVIENRFEITFTYLDENIEGITIIPPSQNISLQQTLSHLQKHSGLLFRQLNKNYVTISTTKQEKNKACGILINAETGKSIRGATIISQNKFAVSNKDGYFELKNLASDKIITIKFLGFEPRSIQASKLNNSPCTTILLQQNTTTLKEVFITNYITQGIEKKIDGSLQVNTEEVGILPGLTEPDVLHTIQALPGIQSINETVSNINVRGGTNDQNLVLWDGIRMYQSGHFFGLISAFNPYLTQNVRLIKNGTPARLGSGVSSTIDIRTEDKLTKKFSGGTGINLINGDLFAKVPLSEKASIQVSARRSIADVIQTPTFKQYFDRAFRDTDVTESSSTADTLVDTNREFYFYDISLKLLYDFTSKDKLRVSFLNVYNDIEYQESELINDTLESKTSGLDQQNSAFGITYSHLWNNKLRTSAHLYFSWYKLGAVNFDILNNQRLIQENEILDGGVKLESRLSLNQNFDLLSGYQFMEIGISNLEDINNPEFRRLEKNVLRTHALFTEGNFSSNANKTNIRAGVRANYYKKFDQVIIEPRVVFNQRLLKNFNLEILGEMKSQTTTQIIDFQTDFLGIEKRRWVLSNNEDIPILRSKQLSAGLHYKKNDFLINVEGYFKEVDGINSLSQGFQNQFQYEKSRGGYKAKGIDFLVNNTFGKLNSWLSYSLADNTFTFEKFVPSTFANNLDISHTISFGVGYQSNRMELSGGINWHTGKPFTEPVEENSLAGDSINYKAPNSSRLENYMRIDVSAKYKFDLGNNIKGLAGISLWNLLNKKNVFNTYYQIDEDNEDNQIKTFQQFALGFTPNFNFRIKF